MDEFQKFALQVDSVIESGDALPLKSIIKDIERRLSEAQQNENAAILNYFRANAYSALQRLNPRYQQNPFEWQQSERTEAILSFRRARKSEAFGSLNLVRRAQILTNLGNELNSIGRHIDAISIWDEALELIPRFAMAAGNRGYSITAYSASLYDPGHQCVFLGEARKSYQIALSPDAVWDSGFQSSVAAHFAVNLAGVSERIKQFCYLDDFNPNGFSLGKTSEEEKFNQWRLDNRLFLNPLNDLGPFPVAAQDVFHMPSHTYPIADEPYFVKLYDLLKQEYTTACVLLWEGVNKKKKSHTSDRNSLIFEHYDYSIFNVNLEKQKTSLRLSFSLLDKIAVFINDFFNLGKNPKSNYVSFRRIWFEDQNCDRLNPNLPKENWPLRGLFSLSLDVYDKDFKELASPLAALAHEVRNAAEHRFLSVHDFRVPDKKIEFCEYVTRDQLYELSLHVIRLARSAIMGLSLAVHHHETFRQRDEGEIRLPIV